MGEKDSVGRRSKRVFMLKEKLNFLGSSLLFLGFALGNDGGAEACSKVVGKFVQDGIAVNFDGLLGGVADNVAVVAPSQVVFQFGPHSFVEVVVQVAG